MLAPATVSAQPAPAPAAPIGADALWAWWWESPSALVRNVEADGFSRVYLYAEGGFDPKVRRTIAALGAQGVEVEALGGEARWATTQRGDMLDFVRSAVAYQRSAPPGAALAGVHLDVEPYDLPSWQRGQASTAASLVGALAAARRTARGLPLTADIPFWFDGIRMGDAGASTLAQQIIRRTDSTTIMAYRDSAPEVIAAARREVSMASRLGKRTAIGLETGHVAPESVTFWEEGRAALVAAVAAIRARLRSDPGFGGIAIHHYESLRSLRP